mmetsp:Transcript_3537/g.10317  ORF Transcript_3537/g.10317 Transcript_3537/m.10317 type:complete len:119 (+) Transcript_3537:145-501(+)
MIRPISWIFQQGKYPFSEGSRFAHSVILEYAHTFLLSYNAFCRHKRLKEEALRFPKGLKEAVDSFLDPSGMHHKKQQQDLQEQFRCPLQRLFHRNCAAVAPIIAHHHSANPNQPPAKP